MSHSKHGKPSFFWPLFLITVGIILLLSNFGILPPGSINMLWRFWPLILVVMGLDILFGRRSSVGAAITTLLAVVFIVGALLFAFSAKSFPEFVGQFNLGEIKHEFVQAPLDNNISSANVSLDLPASTVTVHALSDSNSLFEGDINYYGKLYFTSENNDGHATVSLDTRIEQIFISGGSFNGETPTWDIGLHPRVSLDLSVDGGSGITDLDLAKLDIEHFFFDAGSGATTLTLPDHGQIDAEIDGGSGAIRINLPDNLAAEITIDNGSGAFSPGNRLTRVDTLDGGQTIWRTDDFAGADNFIKLIVDQGSGSIQVR